jgi:endonuclease IV
MSRFLGIHMSLEGHKTHAEALDFIAREYPELRDVQIFTHGPKTFNAVRIDIPKLKAALAKYDMRIWTHGSYLAVPWHPNPSHTAHTLSNVRASHTIGSGCVVVHIPFKTVDVVINGIVPLVEKMREEKLTDCKLMLETGAEVKDPTRSYESPEKLNRLTTALFEAKLEDAVRICIDTAHIFAGRAQISTYDEGKAYCDALDTRLLGMIQLNGNEYHPDVHKRDKHAIPLTDVDQIWRGKTYNESGCKAFVDLGRRLNIPIIMEVNPRHSKESIHSFIRAAMADAVATGIETKPDVEFNAETTHPASIGPTAGAQV